MKIEYGCGYGFDTILEKEITYELVKPCVSQGFMYINSDEDISIFKNLLFLANIAPYKQQDDIIPVTHSQHFKESIIQTPIERATDNNFSEHEIQQISSYVSNNFKFHSYYSLDRVINFAPPLDYFKGLSYYKNLNKFSDQEILRRYNNLQKNTDEMKNLMIQNNIVKYEDSEYVTEYKDLLKPTDITNLKLYKDYILYNDVIDLSNAKNLNKIFEQINLVKILDFNIANDNVNLNKYNDYAIFDNGIKFTKYVDSTTYDNSQELSQIYTVYECDKLSSLTKPYTKDVMVYLNKLQLNSIKSVFETNNDWMSDIKDVRFDGLVNIEKYHDMSYFDMVSLKYNYRDMFNQNLYSFTKEYRTLSELKQVLLSPNQIIVNVFKDINLDIDKTLIRFFDKALTVDKYFDIDSHDWITLFKDEIMINVNNNYFVKKYGNNIPQIENLFMWKDKINSRYDSILNVNKSYSSKYISVFNDDYRNISVDGKYLNSFNMISIYKSISKYLNIAKGFFVDKPPTKSMLLDTYNSLLYKANTKGVSSTKYNQATFDGSKIVAVKSHDGTSIKRKTYPYNIFHMDPKFYYKPNRFSYLNAQFTPVQKVYDLFQEQIVEISRIIPQVYDLYRDIVNTTVNYGAWDINMGVLTSMRRTEEIIDATSTIIDLLNISGKYRETELANEHISIICRNRNVLLAMLGIQIYHDKRDITDYSESFTALKLMKDVTSLEDSVGHAQVIADSKSTILDKESSRFVVDSKNVSSANNPVSVDKDSKFMQEDKPLDSLHVDSKDSTSKEILPINAAPKNYTSLPSDFFTRTLKNIHDAEEYMLHFLSIFKELDIHDKLLGLDGYVNVAQAMQDETKWLDNEKYISNITREQSLTIARELAQLPFIDDLMNNSSSRDILTMEITGYTATTDDFLNDIGNGIDELLLPSEDFNYSSLKSEIFDYTTGQPINPVRRIDDTTFIAKYPVNHPFDFGGDVARKYIDLNVFVLKYLIDVFYQIWQTKIFEFGAYDLRTGVDTMLKYMQIFIEYRMPEHLLDDSWRVFQLIRWYAEATVLENSNYKITFKYKAWKSDLYTGTMSCPNTLTNVIITSGYVLENTANTATIELQQEVKKDGGFVQFDVRILNGSLDIYINNNLIETIVKGRRIRLPIEKGSFDLRLEFTGDVLQVGNIIIDNCEFDDIVTEYSLEPGKANLGVDIISKRIASYYMVTDANFDSMKEALQGVITLKDLTNRLTQYYEEHHMNKTKGKRLTIKKGMI